VLTGDAAGGTTKLKASAAPWLAFCLLRFSSCTFFLRFGMEGGAACAARWVGTFFYITMGWDLSVVSRRFTHWTG
jgi:hypothetical protein